MQKELTKTELARLFILLNELTDSGTLPFWMRRVHRVERAHPHLASRNPSRDMYKKDDYIQHIKRKLT